MLDQYAVPVNGPLSVATIIAALVLAAWFLLRAALNRPGGRPTTGPRHEG